MRISWSWLSEMIDLAKVGGPKGLGDLLTARGLEVESLETQGAGLEKVVTAKLLKRDKHPQADRLSVCEVSVGAGPSLQIVCGAQNMKAGDTVALAQVGALLPNGLKIEKSKIRGVESFGMLCSEEELKFKDTSEGILILPEGTPIGQPLAKVLSKDDSILELKITANRGDCLSHWGIARETAAALGVTPKRPVAPALKEAKGPITIELAAGEHAPQFAGARVEGVKVGPSPAWVVKKLEACGQRSINNLVDATNLVMLELGHPVHAYDADRIEGGKIGVRMSKSGEELPLLDGTSVKCTGAELVIFDAKRAIGLAGVMGGGNSEVTPQTKNVFLECAEFDPKLVRKTASKLQKKSEASHRFERGIDPEGIPHVIARLAQLVTELAGGKVTSYSFVRSKAPAARVIAVKPTYFASFLGMKVEPAQAKQVLTALGCEVTEKGAEWSVKVPSFRRDLSIPEDLAEEIARSLGYDGIAETIPPLSGMPTSLSHETQKAAARFATQNRAKDALVRAGVRETVNFAFTSKAWLAKFGMEPGALVVNPLSEEHEALVPSLLPGLIRNAADNAKHHFGSEPLPIRLFELRPTFKATGPVTASGEMATSMVETWRLAMVLSGPRLAAGMRSEMGEIDFYDLRATVERLFESLGAKGLRFSPMSASRSGGHPLFHPGQSVEILAGKGDVVGAFGLFHPGKARDHKLRAPLWLFEIEWDALEKLSRPAWMEAAFKPWGEFPSIERDFALVVRQDVTAEKITQLALKAGKPLAKVVKIFDVYRGSQVAEGMTSVAVRVIFSEDSRSLQENEAEAASAQILDSWKKELGAELRG